MKSIKLYITTFLFLLCSVSFGWAQQLSQSFNTATTPCEEESLDGVSNDQLWDRGNTAYANGNYVEAERMYSRILCRGMESAELYYNQGNVHHKRGEVGLALLFYYRAERLAPSDSDIKHNIEVLRSSTMDNIEHMPRVFIVEWSEWIGFQFNSLTWSILSIIALVVALAALLFYLLGETMRVRRVGFWSAIAMAILFFVTTQYALMQRSRVIDSNEAVVMSSSVSVTSSPSRASTELFILHEGTKVEVLTTHETWCEIMIDDGKRGWVESARIEII